MEQGFVSDAEIRGQKLDSSVAVYHLFLPKNLQYFKGHFEGAPILPGVCQVHWGIEFGRRAFALNGSPVALKAIKFHHVIRPEQTVELRLDHDRTAGLIQFKFESERGVHSTGRIVWPTSP